MKVNSKRGTRNETNAERGARNAEWMTVRVGDIAEVNPRGDLSHLSEDTIVGFVPMSAVSETTKSIASPETRRFGDVRKGYTPMRNGDVIVAKITPCFENGKLAIVNLDQSFAFGSTEFHVFRPTGEVDSRLLYHLLSSELIQKEGRNQMKGAAGQKRVPSDFFRAFEFRVPRSLLEQKRLAELLDKADGVRRKLQQSLRLSDDFLRSVFLDMFGDPVTNPKGWESVELQDAVKKGTIVTYGIVQAGPEYPGGVPYIRTGDIVNGVIQLDGLRRTDPSIAKKFDRSMVRTGEIVMSIRATVGTTAVVTSALDGANLTQGTARISPGERTLLAYLLFYLRSEGVQGWIQKQVKGATFAEITLGRLRELPVLLPPIADQKRFAAAYEKLEEAKAAQQRQFAESESLFSSLQQRAFKGEL